MWKQSLASESVIPSRVNRELEDTLIRGCWCDQILLQKAREREKDHLSPRDGCFKCGGNHFQRDCPHHVTPRKGNRKKGKQSKSWSKSACKGKSKDGKEQGDGTSKGRSKGSNSVIGSYKSENSKTGLSRLEKQKAESSQKKQEMPQRYHTDNSCTDNSLFDDWSCAGEMMIGAQTVGTKVARDCLSNPQAHSRWEV